MKKVLITGGPVPGKLDDVKIVTNRFKGGLMSRLAFDLWEDYGRDLDITYLTYSGSTIPVHNEETGKNGIAIVYHDGFADYMYKVVQLAPEMDCIVLGAAVANLIPVSPFPGKFPSHNYKPGDVIPINFTIAPRVIDHVKRVNPKASLFGFKLLSNVDHDVLIDAAYHVCLDSKATAIFANDTSDLSKKYAVTKEHSIIPLDLLGYAEFIYEHMHDKYYTTELQRPSFENGLSVEEFDGFVEASRKFWKLVEQYKDRFTKVGDITFGTIAVRAFGDQFVTTVRGKDELEDTAYVRSFCPASKIITVHGSKKASMNAPLLASLFEANCRIDYIVHLHEEIEGLPTLGYAIPGTVKEASYSYMDTSFNIRHHGCILMFDKEGNQL